MTLHDWRQVAAWLFIEMAALIGIAALLQATLLSARARRAIWQGAFCALLLVSVVEVTGFHPSLPQQGIQPQASHESVTSETTFQPAQSALARTAPPALPQSTETRELLVRWPGWVWLAGVLLLLGRICLLLRRRSTGPDSNESRALIETLSGAMRLGPVRCEIWPGLRSPVAFGIFRPAIALPADFSTRFSPAEQQAVLAHELAHLQAHDPFWILVSDLALAFVWWQPLAWWARRRLETATESAADEASALVPDGPHALAMCLVRLGREMTATRPARALGVGGNGPRSNLALRVKHLLGNAQSWREPSLWSRLAAPFLALFIALISALLPVQARTGYSLFTILSAHAEPAGPAIDAASVPAISAAHETLLAQAVATPAAIPTNSSSANKPTILLKAKLISLEVSSKPQIGLDWVFGQSSTNNPAAELSHDWGLLASRSSWGSKEVDSTILANCGLRSPWLTNVNNVSIERLQVSGQSAVLSAEQFDALLKAIEQQAGANILSSPSLITFSGMQAQIRVGDATPIVAGVVIEDSAAKKLKSTLTIASNFLGGIRVDMKPSLEFDGRWQLPVEVSISQLLGYLKSPFKTSADLGIPAGKTTDAIVPWPHFQLLGSSAQATLAIGQTLAIRGPEWTPSNDGRSTSKSRPRCRLYVFVTALTPPAYATRFAAAISASASASVPMVMRK